MAGRSHVSEERERDVADCTFTAQPHANPRPYDLPPSCGASSSFTSRKNCTNKIEAMVRDADEWVGRLEAALKAKGMWDETLIVFSSDNGGVTDGINFPLRGEKHTNWNGAFQVASFVSGGFLPANLRGTSSSLRVSIADWYPTFAALAGASTNDPPPVAPLPIDPSDPGKDIWGKESFPDVDGVNIWPLLTGEMGDDNGDDYAAHHDLWLSAEVMLSGDWKIVVAQPSPELMSAGSVNSGWKDKLGVWHPPPSSGCGLAYKDRTTPFRPCLFNLREDPREENDLSAKEPEVLARLWKQLNETVRYTSRSPSKLLGKCKPECARRKWGMAGGPICGVPGC